MELLSGDFAVLVAVDARKCISNCEVVNRAEGLAEGLEMTFTFTHSDKQVSKSIFGVAVHSLNTKAKIS